MSASVSIVEREYFNAVVAEQGDFNPFADRGWETLKRRFEDWISPGRPLDILDVGAGTGQSRQIYIDGASRYVGIDLSEAAVDVARDRFPDSEWRVADACELPFDCESFDVVAFSSVLHHIPDFGRALAEAFRVLRPGGKVFAFDPNLLHPPMALLRHPRSPLYSPQGVSPNEAPLLPVRLAHEFRRAGLCRVLQRGQSDIPYRAVAPRWANACLSVFNQLDWAWEHSGLGRWFGTFVLTCGEKPRNEPEFRYTSGKR